MRYCSWISTNHSIESVSCGDLWFNVPATLSLTVPQRGGAPHVGGVPPEDRRALHRLRPQVDDLRADQMRERERHQAQVRIKDSGWRDGAFRFHCTRPQVLFVDADVKICVRLLNDVSKVLKVREATDQMCLSPLNSRRLEAPFISPVERLHLEPLRAAMAT